MPNKELPGADEIDLSGIPDEEIGRVFLKKLLTGFTRIPERERVAALRSKLANRAAFIDSIRRQMFREFSDGISGEGHEIKDLSETAEGVASALLGALLKVYPEQLQ